MSTGTQPATPKDITDKSPLKLTPDQIAALRDKLREWLDFITDGTPPDQIQLSKQSAYDVQVAIHEFLDGIQFEATLREAYIRHF